MTKKSQTENYTSNKRVTHGGSVVSRIELDRRVQAQLLCIYLTYTTARNYLDCSMDDLYAINSAKTEFREAFNTGDPERLIALLDPAFVYMPDGVPTASGTDAADAIRAQFRELTRNYVQLVPVIIEIRIHDSVAWDYGWQTWRKTSRDGGSQVTVKDRYVNVWRKNEMGEWKLWMYMSNGLPSQMPTIA